MDHGGRIRLRIEDLASEEAHVTELLKQRI